jgi:hypothetical protein
MDVASLAAVAGLVASVAGLSNVVWANVRHTLAERKLRQAMKSDEDRQARLEVLASGLVDNPDPAKLEEARQIIGVLIEPLSDTEKADILAILDRGSDQSRANYISKLTTLAKHEVIPAVDAE